MIKAIALDDEPLALAILKQFCMQHTHIELLSTFTKTTDALQFIKTHKIDLLFLDIDMPSMTGLDFYQSLPYHPQLILATAYQQFALEGFNLNATDYLLKPFTQERFDQAIEKVKKQMLPQNNSPELSYIWIKADAGNVKLNTADILWIEALDNYIKLHLLSGKTMLTRMPMKNILELLSPEKFVRIHRSFAVAIHKVQQVSHQEIMINDVKLPIGNLYKNEVVKHFGNLQ